MVYQFCKYFLFFLKTMLETNLIEIKQKMQTSKVIIQKNDHIIRRNSMKNETSNIMKNLMMLSIVSLAMFTGIASAVPITEWIKTFDLTNSCDGLVDCIEESTVAESVQQTMDEGYVFAGYRHYLSQPPEPSIVDKTNAVLVKTDKNGNKVWSKIFQITGGQESQVHSMDQTSDGGYILAGHVGRSYQYNGALLIKTDANGNKVLSKKFAGPIITGISGDAFYSVQQTKDGGYIATGTTMTNAGNRVAWLMKTGANGNRVWDKKFGGSSYGIMQSVEQTADGGYITG